MECGIPQQATLPHPLIVIVMAPDQLNPSDHTLSIPPPETTVGDINQTSKTARVQRGQWLRAAILGASDGLLSTASLMLGVSSASEDRRSIIIAGIAGTIAGAFSMALGEFVSVSTQRDVEKDANKLQLVQQLKVEEPAAMPTITVEAGTSSPAGRLPMMRAIATLDHDKEVLPSPMKAALASGLSFMIGSVIPLLSCMFVAQYQARIYVMVAVTTVALAGFGGGAAYLGGSRQVGLSGARVLVGGWLAMGITYWLLKLMDSDDDGSTEKN